MAKQTKTAPAATKSAVILEIFAAQPDATVKAVKAELTARGVKASEALINKIKYSPQRTGGKKKKAARRGKASARGSKAAAIRKVFDEAGLEARTRDVIATLAGRGVKVSAAQVSALRSTAKPGKRRQASTAHAVSFEHLLAAKQLAEQLGGVDAARSALESLAQLLDS